MVVTRTSTAGRLEGLPSVRKLRDGPLESDSDDSGDEGARRSSAKAKNRSRKSGRARKVAQKPRVFVLSDRRCAAPTDCTQTPYWLPRTLRRKHAECDLSCTARKFRRLYCRQEPSTLVEGIEHTFWVVCGDDGSGHLPASSRVRVKVRLAVRFH